MSSLLIGLRVSTRDPVGERLHPGQRLPARRSRAAPPPVEMWVTNPSTPADRTAAAESPPPTTTVAPRAAAAAARSATPRVPRANASISKAPIGPFHTTVAASARQLPKSSTVPGPTSPMTSRAPTSARSTTRVSAPGTIAAATVQSAGRTIRDPAASMTRRATGAFSGSASDAPVSIPDASRKVLAIAPPIRSRSTTGSSASTTSILPEIFAPPRIATKGRRGFCSRAPSTSSSRASRKPATASPPTALTARGNASVEA